MNRSISSISLSLLLAMGSTSGDAQSPYYYPSRHSVQPDYSADVVAMREYSQMIRSLQERVGRGDANAIYRLGLNDEIPSLMTRSPTLARRRPNYVAAEDLYKRAVSHGSLPAAYRLGMLYITRSVVPRSGVVPRDSAYYLVKWASYNGFEPAQNFIRRNFSPEEVRRYTLAEQREAAHRASAIDARNRAAAARTQTRQPQSVDNGSPDLGSVFLALVGVVGIAALLSNGSSSGGGLPSESSSVASSRPATGPDSAQCDMDKADVAASHGTGTTEMDGTTGEPASCVGGW